MNKKVILEKQIAILDKALSLNFKNDRLIDIKWTLAEDYFTPEEVMLKKKPIIIIKLILLFIYKFNKELLKELEKYNSAKPLLWHYYINANQNSLSECATSSVLKRYSDAMFALGKLKRGLPLNEQLGIQQSIIG